MKKTILCIIALTAIFLTMTASADQIKALIVTTANSYAPPLMKNALLATGRFEVSTSIVTDQSKFNVVFSAYDVIICDYNGGSWPDQTKSNFVEFVRNGGGVVIMHASSNAFGDWKEYNEITGLGGWGSRNEKSGPYVRWRNGRIIQDNTPGIAGSHGAYDKYLVEVRQPEHPIVRGLGNKWIHGPDELYDRLRGPAKNMTVIATAYSAKDKGGSGEHEPVLFTVEYGKGRCFHTVFGHDATSMENASFTATFARGTEWAATGDVAQSLPRHFSTEKDDVVWPGCIEPGIDRILKPFRDYLHLLPDSNERTNIAADLLIRLYSMAVDNEDRKKIIAGISEYPCQTTLDFTDRLRKDNALKDVAQVSHLAIKSALAAQFDDVAVCNNAAEADYACDGKVRTRWTTQHAMAPGDWFMFKMKEAYTVKKVVLENTTSQQDYPRGYELYASLDGKNWGRVIKKGKGTSDKTVIELDNSVTARYFKIIQTGREETFWWSIDEISLEVE